MRVPKLELGDESIRHFGGLFECIRKDTDAVSLL